MIHTTVGVYPDGSMKSNGVESEGLADHIEYNLLYRPGRALFLDGVVIHKGIGVNITDELFATVKAIKETMDTMPYV